MNAFTIFQTAQATLDKNPKDEQAQFTVDLWNASKNLSNKNATLQAEVESLKAQLASANSDNATYARNQDMLESKLSMKGNDPVPFNASTFMQSMIASSARSQA